MRLTSLLLLLLTLLAFALGLIHRVIPAVMHWSGGPVKKVNNQPERREVIGAMMFQASVFDSLTMVPD